MDRAKETELWDHLARTPRLREWLQEQFDEQTAILVVNPDVEQLRKAQGRAQFAKAMIDKLAAAEAAAKKR